MSRTLAAIPAVIGVGSALFLDVPETRDAGQYRHRPAIYSALDAPGDHVLSTMEQGFADTHCPLGMPVVPEALYGPTWIVAREGYVLEYAAIDRIPLWVAQRIDAGAGEGGAQRKSSFSIDDPQDGGPPKALQPRHDDYTNTRFARGHMAAADDFASDQTLMDETFVITNVVPQNGPMNSGDWRSLEDELRERATLNRPVFVVTGPMFYDPMEEEAAQADGLVAFRSIGKRGVSVPTHLYKVAAQRSPTGAWELSAYAAPNVRPAPDVRPEDWRVPVNWVEERTGIDFFSALPDAEEEALESRF